MRMPVDAPFFSVAFSFRNRSSSAFISSSDMAFSFFRARLARSTVSGTRKIWVGGGQGVCGTHFPATSVQRRLGPVNGFVKRSPLLLYPIFPAVVFSDVRAQPA